MGARACGHTQPQKLAAGMPQDQKSIQQPKRDRRDYEQIHRRNAVGMIAQKVFQPCDGGCLLLAMYFATVVCPTSMPSLSSSPWIRGASQSGFAALMSRMSWRMSVGVFGRPPRGRDFQRQ